MNLTQTELAEILGVTMNTVARWERGLLEVPRMVELALPTVKIKLKKKGK